LGIVLDEKGNVIDRLENAQEPESHDPNIRMLQQQNAENNKKNDKKYTSIDKYKPTGNLVYNPELFEKLEKKVTFA
jgi:hypothetical protein